MEADDLALVSAARGGDPAAFRALVVRHQRKAYAVALGIVKDRDMAWDVAQEAFVRVHRHLANFNEEARFSTWLLRITTHLAIDSVRKERTAAKQQLEDVRDADLEAGGEGILATELGRDPQQNLLRRELAAKMMGALGQLPEIHRTILVLREVEGLSYEELAERLGIHKGTVMSRLFHARKKMQVLLQEYAGLAPAPSDHDDRAGSGDVASSARNRRGAGRHGEGEP